MPCNIQREFADVDLGDRRRDRRVALLAARLAESPSLAVSGACGGWAETMAGYRLVHSEAVTPEKLLEAHRTATLERARAGGESLLLIQDTTELDYTDHPSLKGVGPLSCLERRGFFLHNHLLVAEGSEVPLGLCGTQIVNRKDQEHGKAKLRKQRPIQEKESMRWLHGYAEACAIAEALPNQEVTMVADRECDIYEVFARHRELREQNAPCAELLIRAKSDRCLSESSLFATAQSAPLLGTYELDFEPQLQFKKNASQPRRWQQREGRKGARIEVRATQVRLRAPFRAEGKLAEVELSVVWACETDPPAGQSAVCWVLLSTLPCESFKDALRILRAYRLRWRVEELHRVLKTGCRVEALSFADATSLQTLVALYLVVSWRILYLRDLARAEPAREGSEFFSEAEWKSACLLNRRPCEKPPPLGEMMKMVAVMGGYLARRNDPPPGPERLWRGLTKLQHYVEMATILGAI